MTARRLAHTPASPRMTSGYDRPAPACQGNPEPYDVLHDYISGPAFRAAKDQALETCGACPLRAACWTENRDSIWVKALAGRWRNTVSPERRQRLLERDLERIAALEAIIADGGNMARARRETKLSEKGLYALCRRRGEGSIWTHLQSTKARRKSNQYYPAGAA